MQQVNDRSYGIVPVRRFEDDWQFLIVKHLGGHWAFPKGHPEAKELPKEAAIRELKEETGLVINRFLNRYPFSEQYVFFHAGQRICKSVIYYLAEVTGELHAQKEELLDAQWLPFEACCECLTYPCSVRICQQSYEFLLSDDPTFSSSRATRLINSTDKEVGKEAAKAIKHHSKARSEEELAKNRARLQLTPQLPSRSSFAPLPSRSASSVAPLADLTNSDTASDRSLELTNRSTRSENKYRGEASHRIGTENRARTSDSAFVKEKAPRSPLPCPPLLHTAYKEPSKKVPGYSGINSLCLNAEPSLIDSLSDSTEPKPSSLSARHCSPTLESDRSDTTTQEF